MQSKKACRHLSNMPKEFIDSRLAPAHIPNDGKQTPMKSHPVFIAQHACASCCRDCLQKWYGVPKGRELSEREQLAIVAVLMVWIEQNRVALAPLICSFYCFRSSFCLLNSTVFHKMGSSGVV